MKKTIVLMASLSSLFVSLPGFAQVYAPQYNPGTVVTNSNQPVIVPPTVIMPPDQNSSKKSCKQNVIDLFLIRWSTMSGDCTP